MYTASVNGGSNTFLLELFRGLNERMNFMELTPPPPQTVTMITSELEVVPGLVLVAGFLL